MNSTINKIIISPPFGTYISIPNITPVLGTFTETKRSGKWVRALKTIRYTKHGWINSIGLRNPGINSIQNWNYKSIYSFSKLNSDVSWDFFIKKIPININIEVNVSCPNVSENISLSNSEIYFLSNLNKETGTTIFKVAPTTSFNEIQRLIDNGANFLHISNTLKTSKGGLSGPTLQQYNLPMIEQVRNKYPHIKVVAGGGIYSIHDVIRYTKVGSDYFSLSTVFFNPLKTITLLRDLKYFKYI